MYTFHTVNQLVDLTDLGNRLLSGELTGIILEDFITIDEASKIEKGFYGLSNDLKTIVDEGFTSYPSSFAQFTQGIMSGSLEPQVYHSKALRFRSTFESTFGVDIETRLKEVATKLFSGKTLQVPVPKESEGSYIPFTFRELKPTKGELKVHCENLFFKEFPLFFELLDHLVLRKNEFSFFIVVSDPEAGGELTLFDINWQQTKTRETFTILSDSSGRRLDIESDEVKKLKLKPKAGSLLIFSGGDIWHRVEIVEGSRSRITIGGFFSAGKRENEMYMWS